MKILKNINQGFVILAGLFIACLVFWNLLPDPLFDDPYSTIVFDRENDLLGARIASDGQWRFPQPESVPGKFEICILNFEDQYFHRHPGVNPFSLFRALVQNIKEKEIVSGGSTLSMQVIRLSRKGKSRTLSEKFIEIILTMRLELQYSKEEILKLYAGNAPFGGNVVGIETASWRYFDRSPENLSWAETAMLAVLPNSPALIHPGRNPKSLLEKRNRLLLKLYSKGLLDEQTYHLSVLEEIPDKPMPLPDEAYHLTQHFEQTDSHKRIKSTIDKELQEKLNKILSVHKNRLYTNQVHNAACIIVDASNAEVIAYIGNLRNSERPDYGGDVDIIRSRRSTGSILKPFLYAEMQYRGEILPNTLIPDIPTRYRGYSPKNYKRDYDGVVTASNSLSRSLNVPSVRMLLDYGNQRFLDDLHELGFSTMDYSSEHYGLSLILGGAETNLWDLARVYTSFSRVLNSYNESNGNYFLKDWEDLKLVKNARDEPVFQGGTEQGKIGAGAIWLTFEALRKVNRPNSETGWEFFNSPRKIAWKTGTSFGFRDGWAVACTPEYIIAVWTGNASGEGRPGLTGINSAAPVLFDIINSLPTTSWFKTPYDDLHKTVVCRQSGHKAGRNCEDLDTVWVSPAGLNTTACPYHKIIHLDENMKFRVKADCYSVNKMIQAKWFVLPPAQEWYHLKKNSAYKSLPPLAANCTEEDIANIQVIYPERNSIIYVPKELSGEKGKVVFEIAHRHPEKTIFWSIDEEFIQTTKDFHQLSLQPSKGQHILTLVDENGERLQVPFEVVDRQE